MLNTSPSLDTPESASFLGVKADTLKGWRKKRQGPPFIKAGRRVVYRLADLAEWQNAHRVIPEPFNLPEEHHATTYPALPPELAVYGTFPEISG